MKELNIKSRLHNEADVLEVDDKSLSEAVIPFIEADKDVISKIKMEYDENDDFTSIIFPNGIMPLSITINTHTLFIKDESLVNELGEEVEGYAFDGYYADVGILHLDVVGNITEQIINELNYVSYDSDAAKYTLLKDTYHLYHPVTATGTKLYKYTITGGNIASQGSTPLVIITYEKLNIPSEGTAIGQLLADKFILTGSYPYHGGQAVLNKIGTSSAGFYCYGGGNQEFTGTDFTTSVTEL